MANACHALFSLGTIGAFQGKLNPLLCKASIQACVLPVCLGGRTTCNWILTETLLDSPECFQAELG